MAPPMLAAAPFDGWGRWMRLARAIPLLVLAIGCPAGVEARKEPKRDADWVVAQLARFSRADTAYRLRARLELVADDGTIIPGIYERIWVSPDRWRQEIRVADYRDSQGATGDRAWSSRSLPFRPWNVRQAIESFGPVLPAPGVRLDFRKLPARNGRPDLACAGVEGAWICVDATSGAPVLRELPAFRLRHDYGPLRQFDLGPWPEEVRLIDADREIGRLVVERIEPIPASALDGIQPPEGAEIFPACRESRDAEIIPSTKVKPKYPRDLQEIGVSGYVIFQVTVDEEGRVKELQPLRASHPRFVEPAGEVLAKWRFAPMLCDGKARRVQREIAVQFNAD